MYSAEDFANEMRDMTYSKDGEELIALENNYIRDFKVPGMMEVHQALFGNNFVPQNSAWTEFAKIFKIGAMDLDKLAINLGIKGGYSELEMYFNPKSLYQRFKIQFLAVLQVISNIAKKYNVNKLEQIIQKI